MEGEKNPLKMHFLFKNFKHYYKKVTTTTKSHSKINQTQNHTIQQTSLQLEQPFRTKVVEFHIVFYALNIEYFYNLSTMKKGKSLTELELQKKNYKTN